jgi:hypothetical protein
MSIVIIDYFIDLILKLLLIIEKKKLVYITINTFKNCEKIC